MPAPSQDVQYIWAPNNKLPIFPSFHWVYDWSVTQLWINGKNYNSLWFLYLIMNRKFKTISLQFYQYQINSCAKSAWYARRQHSYNICKDFLSHNSWMKNLNFTNSCTINMNWNVYTIFIQLKTTFFWEISKNYQFQ